MNRKKAIGIGLSCIVLGMLISYTMINYVFAPKQPLPLYHYDKNYEKPIYGIEGTVEYAKADSNKYVIWNMVTQAQLNEILRKTKSFNSTNLDFGVCDTIEEYLSKRAEIMLLVKELIKDKIKTSPFIEIDVSDYVVHKNISGGTWYWVWIITWLTPFPFDDWIVMVITIGWLFVQP